MKNHSLLVISSLITILGLFILLILCFTYEPPLTKIKDITNDSIDQKIKIIGNITKIRDYKTFKIISINDSSGVINVLLNDRRNLTKNLSIEVIGKVSIYNDRLEIINGKIK